MDNNSQNVPNTMTVPSVTIDNSSDSMKIFSMVITLLIVAIVSYVAVARHTLVAQTISQNSILPAVLLLSPEIATGIATIVKAFSSY
jgi:hypothetical protein